MLKTVVKNRKNIKKESVHESTPSLFTLIKYVNFVKSKIYWMRNGVDPAVKKSAFSDSVTGVKIISNPFPTLL